MNLVRKLKIGLVHQVEYTEKEAEIIKFISGWMEDLIPFMIKDAFPDSIFYMKFDGVWVLEKDNQTKKLIVRDDFIDVLIINYRMSINDINSLIFYMLKKLYNVDVEESYYVQSATTSSPTYIEREFMKKNNIVMDGKKIGHV